MSEGLYARLAQRTPIPLAAELRCAAGELAALVGPSGSGKSTVLRCIAGLNRPHEGEVRCGGSVWFNGAVDLPPQQRRCGLVFQSYALFPHLSALRNVTLAAGHLPSGERDKRGRDLLELVNLSGLEARRPAQLSGGQQQRVALARALARDPQVLLLDEPFAAVDRVTRRKLQRELALLRERVRIPIVLVTHDLDEARMLADSMTILHHGNTLQRGSPAEIMARPGSAEVARLLDLGNLFEAVVLEHRAERNRTVLDWGGLELEATHAPAFRVGERTSWVIAPEYVILHRRDRPSRGERENPVDGVVRDCVVLGETTSVVIEVRSQSEATLAMNIPTHHARRNRLAPGEAVTVSLLVEGIHVMPWGAAPR
ncbi:MAG: ABC transporter ATP-binding protein [Betaproteobacteria bacterium]|nr:ABC transporter ATP-binding protein [Betaproteobacteria bacterium]